MGTRMNSSTGTDEELVKKCSRPSRQISFKGKRLAQVSPSDGCLERELPLVSQGMIAVL